MNVNVKHLESMPPVMLYRPTGAAVLLAIAVYMPERKEPGTRAIPKYE